MEDPLQFALQTEDRFTHMHVDLNSFFASVEQQLHEEYRGKPLAVVPTMADTTCAIAASYEAKELKIKTGTRVSEMKKICPEIILVQGNHSDYSAYSGRISKAIETVCPIAHTPSIDEVTLELIGREQEPPRARQMALQIKDAIREQVGDSLRCSIGLAPNRYLAKIASDIQKPDGLIGLLPSQLPRAIAHLDLNALPGVGRRTEASLNRKGITTMQQLLELSREEMHKLWNSVWGDRLYHWLRGYETGDDGAPVSSGIQKSLGHSHVLAPQFRTSEGAWSVAHKLLHKAAMRLRLEKFYAGSMALTIKYSLTREQADSLPKTKKHTSGITHTGWGMEARFPACRDTLTLMSTLQQMWKQAPQDALHARPFFIGITLNRLQLENEQQPNLFGDADPRQELSAVMDKLNEKYGHSTLHLAGMLGARDSAETRIAFTQIPVQYGVDWM